MFVFCYFLSFLLGVAVVTVTSTADPLSINIADKSSKPFLSAGKKAVCVTGNIKVTVTATNTRLRLPELDSQSTVTEIIQELIQANSTIIARSSEGKQTLTGTYSIAFKLCSPAKANISKSQTVQILTHGVGLDNTYWDLAPGYSYVDAAAAAGYTTLSYDRLGVGQSDHPDPIQVVQSHVDLEILHALVQHLRSGKLGSQRFKHVVGVGHSYGSIITIGVAAKYPKDFDAIVTTGFSTAIQELGYTIAANNPTIAELDQPSRFGSLSKGYLVHNDAISIQLAFYRYPYYDLDGIFFHLTLLPRLIFLTYFPRVQLASCSQTDICACPAFHHFRYITAGETIHWSCRRCLGPVRFSFLQRRLHLPF